MDDPLDYRNSPQIPSRPLDLAYHCTQHNCTSHRLIRDPYSSTKPQKRKSKRRIPITRKRNSMEMAEPNSPPETPTTTTTTQEDDRFSESNRLYATAVIELDHLDSGDDATAPPFSWPKLWEFTGPGVLMSTAFLDPGNIEGDLQAGAVAGYSLLWLLLWATLMGLLIQLVSARVGVATGKGLAELCREHYPPKARYLLWAMAEVAVIAADIQEVIGTAIAIKILSRGAIPLWASIVVTAVDCFAFLFLENYGVRKLEAGLAMLVATMGLSFAWMFIDAAPNPTDLLLGTTVPKLSSKTVQQAVGIIGCIITPHNVYLHSSLVQSRDINRNHKSHIQAAITYNSIESSTALLLSFLINLFVTAVFAEGFNATTHTTDIGLENAGKYLEHRHGGGALPVLYLWGVGLLAAGQSSTIAGTYAGQFIMEGFFDFRLKRWMRAVVTRSFAIVPTMAVALAFDTSGAAMDVLNEWLNVVQSMQIPFVLIPLFTMASKEKIMGVFKIGPFLERLTWSVFAVVMAINGYVILDFFMNKVDGLLFGLTSCLVSVAYIAFIVYLFFYDRSFPSQYYQRFPIAST